MISIATGLLRITSPKFQEAIFQFLSRLRFELISFRCLTEDKMSPKILSKVAQSNHQLLIVEILIVRIFESGILIDQALGLIMDD